MPLVLKWNRNTSPNRKEIQALVIRRIAEDPRPCRWLNYDLCSRIQTSSKRRKSKEGSLDLRWTMQACCWESAQKQAWSAVTMWPLPELVIYFFPVISSSRMAELKKWTPYHSFKPFPNTFQKIPATHCELYLPLAWGQPVSWWLDKSKLG